VPLSAVQQHQASLAFAWSQIVSGKPTTLGGYGITDGITAAVAAATYAPLSSFSRSLSQNGFQALPGGLILQWGLCNPNGGAITVALPTGFPNAAFSAQSTGLTTATITVRNTGGQSYFWAVGN
jgi:hypothetical protein